MFHVQVTDGRAEYKKHTATIPSSLQSSVAINDAKWHNVTLTVTMDTAVLDVDGNQVMSDAGFSPQTLEVSSMSVGGAPSNAVPDSTGTLRRKSQGFQMFQTLIR